MKTCKKLLCALLTLAMVLSMTVLPASAEEAVTGTITAGETKNIDLPAESALHLLFTPAESGYYIFYTAADAAFDWWAYYEGTVAEGEYRLYPEQWNDPEHLYRGEVLYAQAGKTYLLEIENFQAEPVSGFFTVVKAKTYETFTFDREAYTGYAGTDFSIFPTMGPDDAYEAVTWTSSDPQVAYIGEMYPNATDIILSAPGTAVITASTDSGNSASCTVTVKEPETIAAGESKSFTLAGYEEARYIFIPAQSGRYILYVPRGGSCYHSVYEGADITEYPMSGISWSDPESKYYGFAVDLTAGQPYTVVVRESYGKVQAGALTLLKAAPYESLKIQELYQPKVGDEKPLYADTAPATASEHITWTSSNPDIAEIHVQDFYVGAILKAPGTVTITATANSGVSDSYTFTVADVRTLQLGEPVDVTIEPAEYAYFDFTPEESGRYIIYAPADACIGSNAEDESYSRIYEEEWISADGAYQGDSYALTGGVRYRINAYISGEQKETVSTSVTMVKAANFDTFTLSRQTMNYYVGDYETLHIVATPDFSSEAVTWESSDPSVVSIVGGYAIKTYLDCVGPGTATVTATTETGKTATCVVTVREPVQLEKNVEYTATVDVQHHIPCYFTAPEDGIYTMAALGEGNYYVNAWDLEGAYVEGAGTYHRRNVRCETFEMKAGQTLKLNLYNGNDFETEFRFMIAKDLKATHITLPVAEETVYVGHNFYLRVFFEPILAMEETATWEISDPEVLQLRNTHHSPDEGGYDYYEFLTKKTGTVTLTATSESGLQASCVIHVEEVPVIEFGEHTTKPLCAEEYARGFHQVDYYCFTPAVTQEYNLYWKKGTVDEDTFISWYGLQYFEETAWENDYYAGVRATIPGTDSLKETEEKIEKLEAEIKELEAELENLPDGLEKEELTLLLKQKQLEIETWKEELEIRTKELRVTVAVQNSTLEPETVTFWVEPYTGEEPHVHAPEFVAERAAGLVEPGMKAHYACHCGKRFADAAGEKSVTAEELTIPRLIQVADGRAELDQNAISEAVSEAEQHGEVLIPVAAVGEVVTSTALPAGALTQIAEKEAVLTVEMSSACVTLDTAALTAVTEKAGDGAVTLEVTEIPEEDLTETQLAAIEELDKNLVTAISAQLLVDGQSVAGAESGGFGSGKATVKLLVELAGEDYTVLYIADDGTATVVENTTYENGVLTLELEHFSTYAILQDCLPGDVNDDGDVTILDLMRLANHFAKNAEINKANADVNVDGKVTILDLMRLANYFAGKAQLGK